MSPTLALYALDLDWQDVAEMRALFVEVLNLETEDLIRSFR